ncbi:tubulin polymerization-promoting protein family member 2-like isoform X2 [Podarcis muralis]
MMMMVMMIIDQDLNSKAFEDQEHNLPPVACLQSEKEDEPTKVVGNMSELEKTFRKFAVYGETSNSGNEITGKNFSKMLKECDVMDGKFVTSTDVDIVFNKVKTKGARNMNYIEFQQAVKELSRKRFQAKSPEEALLATYQLMEGKEPASTGTKSTAASVVERLTDTSKYTGSHKERFDETGRGKGLAGRTDPVESHTGYVSAYKGAGTYDKYH